MSVKLAPRGWRCFGLYGSNGATLIVTPERHGSELLTEPGSPLKGPAVEVISRESETSGRFDVANAAAGLFPSAGDFVRQVAAEGLEPLRPWKPSASDRITSRSADRVEFITAAGSRGLGTLGRISPSQDPIGGAILLHPSGEGLTVVNTRLTPRDRDLAPTIIRQVEARIGVSNGADRR